MDYFISLVEATAWPITVLILVLSFRSQLKALLGKLAKLRFRDLEAQFESIARPQATLSDKADVEPAVTESEASSTEKVEERRRTLLAKALDRIEKELDVPVRRVVSFFRRDDLLFTAAAFKEGPILMDVIVLGEETQIPEDRLEAFEERAAAVAAEAHRHGYEFDYRLIIMIISDLTGEAYFQLEKTLRRKSRRSALRDFRIYHTKMLELESAQTEVAVDDDCT